MADYMHVGDLEVRLHERVVFAHGHEISLTAREFDIIVRMAEHPGWVFSANQLSGQDDSEDYSPESVSVLVSRLRQKLAAAGAPEAIETVRGFGYRLSTVPADATDAPAGLCRELRDAAWQLQEAVMEAEHTATLEQQRAVIEALEQARRAVFSCLAE